MSGFLVDTNFPSETIGLRPEPRVTKGIAKQTNEVLFISVVSIGELRQGFITAPDPQRRSRLERWLETDVMQWFDGRILPLTREIADAGAPLTARVN